VISGFTVHPPIGKLLFYIDTYGNFLLYSHQRNGNQIDPPPVRAAENRFTPPSAARHTKKRALGDETDVDLPGKTHFL
jgi:hypothetical protein